MHRGKKSRDRKAAAFRKNTDNVDEEGRSNRRFYSTPVKDLKTNENSIDEPNNEHASSTSFSNFKHETDEIVKLTETQISYSKRKIVSNWSKYETLDESNDNKADFSTLLHAPQGGHFKFKIEKDWEEQFASKYSDYFSLDLQCLNNSIMSIPFYERHEIDTDLFNDHQLEKMDNQAVKYQNKIKCHQMNSEKKKTKKPCVKTDESSSKVTHKLLNLLQSTPVEENKTEIYTDKNNSVPVISENLKNTNLDTIDDLLSLRAVETPNKQLPHILDIPPTSIEKVPAINTNTVDLEQWLDDILDD